MQIKSEAKFWDVRFSQPATRKYNNADGIISEYAYSQNVHVMVAAESAKKVIDLVMAEYPNATVHQINHRGGNCGIIVQVELIGR